MLNFLRSRNQRSVENGWFSVFRCDERIALLDNLRYRFTVAAFLISTQHSENLFQSLDLLLGLGGMQFEGSLQLFIMGCFGHLRERLRDLLLSAVQLIQFMQ